MKKLILLAIVFISFTTISNAQNVNFGVKAGINLSSVSGDEDATELYEGRTAFHIGLVGELTIVEKFGLQAELLYSSQGADIKVGDFKTNVDYLNVPILAKYKFLKVLDLHAGPQFGIQVSEGKDIDPEDYQSFDISGAVGAGVKVTKFFAQIRYNFGLTNIVDVENAPNLKNSVFQISVGYYIF